MVGKSFFFLTIVAALCQLGLAASDTNKEIVRSFVQFDLSVDGTSIPYTIDYLMINYRVAGLTIERNKNSTDIKIPGVLLQVVHGHPEDEGSEYTFVRSQSLHVDIAGTVELHNDGPYLKSCQFTFTQTAPITDKVPAVVKQTLLENLNDLIGNDLCHSINDNFKI